MSLNPRELGTTGATLIFLYGLPNDLPRHVKGKLNGEHPNCSRPTIEFVRGLVGFIWLPVGVQLVFIFYMANLVLNAHSAESRLAEPDTPWFLITIAIVVLWFHCFGTLPLGVRALMFVHDAGGGTHEMAEGAAYDEGSDEDPLPPAQTGPAMTSAAQTLGPSTLMLGQSWALASRPGGDYGYQQLRDAVIKNKTILGMCAVHEEVQTIEITVDGSHRPGGHHE
ncbi:unnamed protein product [Prorocentrum cordatum]|uniref:Uncharacterized protein n=1 Tax=Prorocentrum cordatum TaxID=2364126 RepID=A0ABN9VW53_9DINO|nr:unnamed protein product [Polarella glacialis]